MCGNLDPSLQSRIDGANAILNANGRVEYTPCEATYISVRLRTEGVDTLLINHLHSVLNDESSREGWPVLLVYDDNGTYLVSHHFSDRFYTQSGD